MNKSILLSKSDYKFLSEHFEKAIISDYNKSRLRTEIKQATIFKDDELPNDVVSLHTEAKQHRLALTMVKNLFLKL